ncbi:MAG: PilZ domain-containing protein [Thermodesulfobacteriota bacterium]|nr:PilZ domain-containing protein [Thermodesulfobacteriota bacterium]
MSNKDKRTRERYGLKLPVEVTWEDALGRARRERTTTQDLSVLGCFIVCDDLIQRGCKVSVEIDLSIARAGVVGKRVSAQGRVVRNAASHNPKGGFGHGIRFDKFRFSKE